MVLGTDTPTHTLSLSNTKRPTPQKQVPPSLCHPLGPALPGTLARALAWRTEPEAHKLLRRALLRMIERCVAGGDLVWGFVGCCCACIDGRLLANTHGRPSR